MSAPSVAVIVVTWNCRELALECLRQLLASHVPGGLEVVVVDNASVDGTPDAVAVNFPAVKLICNSNNVGFAAANNQGLRATASPFVLLLNPDAFPATSSTFAGMVANLEADPELAAVGPRLVFADGRHQVGDAGYRPTLAHAAVWCLGLHALLPGLYVAGMPRRSVHGVDWVCGAAMMVRRCAIDDVGPLDERFFMYAEDVEWGCRFQRAGWRLGYLRGETVTHLQGGTQPDAPRGDWLESLCALHRDQCGERSYAAFCALLWAGFSLRGLAYLLLSRSKATAMFAYARHVRRIARSATREVDPKEAAA